MTLPITTLHQINILAGFHRIPAKKPCLVARVFVPEVGPCVTRVDGESLVDITAAFPTVRDLCEEADPEPP